MMETNMIIWLILIGVAIISCQIYVSIVLYRYEKSIWWGCIGFILLFGLNVYAYQILKLEKRAGYSYNGLTQIEQSLWRKVYFIILVQYLLLFAVFGWIVSP